MVFFGQGEICGIVKIEDDCKAYFYDLRKKEYVRDDSFLAAKWNEGTDFWEVTEEEAMKTIEELNAEESSEDKE